MTKHLVQALGGRHGSLDDKAANVLPALLQEGDEVVDGQHQVTNELLSLHTDVTNGNTEAENLLKLELDGGLDVVDLVLHVLGVGDGGGELAGLGQTGTKETGNLLDQSLGSKEGIVLASKLLDELFVLVQLLQVVGGHGIETVVLGTVKIVLVTNDTVGRCQWIFVVEISLCPSTQKSLTDDCQNSNLGVVGSSGEDKTYQMLMLGRGMEGSLMVPEKRLSRWGS